MQRFYKITSFLIISNIFLFYFIYSKLRLYNLSLNHFENTGFDLVANYTQLSQNVLKSQKPRVIFNEAPSGNGYGNKIYSLISSILVGLLSDRALILYWSDIDLFIDTPLILNYQAPESSELNKNFKKAGIKQLSYSQPPHTMEKQPLEHSLYTLPQDERLGFFEITAFFFQLCSSQIYLKKLLDYRLVSLTTILRANETINEFIQKKNQPTRKNQEFILKVGFEAASNVLRYFWKPKKFIKDYIDNFYLEHFKNNFIIGIQIRTVYLDMKDYRDIQRFAECAYSINPKAKWFITSDSQKVIEYYQENYKDYKILTTNGTIGHISHNNNIHYWRSIIDCELLSLTNEHIVTGGSTYGFTSSIRANKLPYFINGFEKTNLKCELMSFLKPPSTIHKFSTY